VQCLGCSITARLLLLTSHTRLTHSIVPGGLLVTSYTTRLTPFTSLMMRVAARAEERGVEGVKIRGHTVGRGDGAQRHDLIPDRGT
jgi:hypothetical protein